MSPVFRIEIQRTQYVEVDVEAETLEAARNLVDRRDFPLPNHDEWSTFKDAWLYKAPMTDGEYDKENGDWEEI